MNLFPKVYNWIQNHKIITILVLLFPIIYFPIFYKLDMSQIMLWDESRQAINTYEMVHNGNLFVPHFNGEHDLYNSKPPLLIWFQSIFWILLSNKELAMRLPSALAAVFTCFSFVWFTNQLFQKPWIGAIAAICLVTLNGYIDLHCTRTGDYDGLLTLFTTLFCMHYFVYLIQNNRKNLMYFYLYFGLAFATKAAAPLMFLPALLLITIFLGKFKFIIRSKQTYLYSLIFIGLAFVFYGIRIIIDPGYALATWNNDFGGRFLTTIEGHYQDPEYYWLILREHRAQYLIWFIPLLTIVLLLKDKLMKQTALFLLVCLVVFFLLITIAKTKLYWYASPLYPFIAMIAAFVLAIIFEYLNKIKKAIGILFLGAAFYFLSFPYREVLHKISFNPYFDWEGIASFYQQSHYFRNLYNDKSILKNDIYVLSKNEYIPHYDIYVRLINDQNLEHKIIHMIADTFKLKLGDEVIYMNENIKDSALINYKMQTIDTFKLVKHQKVIEVKP